jgi:propanol-preferring alcohol dehydrogenase
MKAMVIEHISSFRDNQNPLKLITLPIPEPGNEQILIKVSTCGVCHTELDEIEGRTAPSMLPVVPGHQAIGKVVKCGVGAGLHQVGDRVGVAWIYHACGSCAYCTQGMENLCLHFKATGRDCNGGYAEYMVAPEGFAYSIPEVFTDAQAAPLLCAGAIGYRSLRLTNLQNGQTLGLTGLGPRHTW